MILPSLVRLWYIFVLVLSLCPPYPLRLKEGANYRHIQNGFTLDDSIRLLPSLGLAFAQRKQVTIHFSILLFSPSANRFPHCSFVISNFMLYGDEIAFIFAPAG